MIRSICCVCGIQYGIKFDGQADVRDSHGYCERHYDEAMTQLHQCPFAEYPEDRPHVGAVV